MRNAALLRRRLILKQLKVPALMVYKEQVVSFFPTRTRGRVVNGHCTIST